MKEIIIRKGKELYKFKQDGNERIIVGLAEDYKGVRGQTVVTYSEIVTKDFGNAFYKDRIDEGFRRV